MAKHIDPKLAAANRDPDGPDYVAPVTPPVTPPVSGPLPSSVAVRGDELAGRITAAGFVVAGECGDPVKLTYVVPGVTPDWTALKAIVSAQCAAQSDGDATVYCAGMLAAAQVGKSDRMHRALTQFSGPAKHKYSGDPNPSWSKLRARKREFPIVIAFDTLANVPSPGKSGGASVIATVDVAGVLAAE